ncbi:MAG: hypothetical protein R2834_13930 [Rhodothermales bacterium]
MDNQFAWNFILTEEQRQKEKARLLQLAAQAGTRAKLFFFFGALLSIGIYLTFFGTEFGEELRLRNRVVTGTLRLTDSRTQHTIDLYPGATYAIRDSTAFIYLVSSGDVRGTVTRRDARATSIKDHAWQHALYVSVGVLFAALIVGYTHKLRSDSWYRAAAQL